MALVSPGVQVSVIDESFYTPAEPGTVPMIFVASHKTKQTVPEQEQHKEQQRQMPAKFS